jgi:hypothetical protein
MNNVQALAGDCAVRQGSAAPHSREEFIMRHHARTSLTTVAIATALVMFGCLDDAPEDTGSIGMELQLAPGVTISTVNWAISNATTGFMRSSTVNVRSSNTLKFLAGAIPAATGYTITLTASSIDGAFACTGSAGFAVTAGTTSTVGLIFNCSTAPAGQGTIVVDGTTQVCANLDSVSASPLETAVNTPIALSATGSAGTVPTTFLWMATAGTFDNPASATPTFTCPSTPGPVTITARVLPSPAGCNTVTTQDVVVNCDTLNPTFTNVYASIIGVRCIGCHRPGGSGVTVGLLDMSTPAAAYTNLVGVAGQGIGAGTSGVTCASVMPALTRVIPSDSAGSLLFNKTHSKLVGTLAACGSPMPLPGGAAPLTAAEVNLIAAWIDAGALNN